MHAFELDVTVWDQPSWSACGMLFQHVVLQCFAGPAEGLRASLQRASGRFFPAHHSANVSLLVSLLDAELWTPLPVPAHQ